MALVTTKEMFKKAFEGKYSIGAFNINNMEINVITDFFCLFIFFPFSSFFLIIF